MMQQKDRTPPAKRRKIVSSTNDAPNTESLDKGLAKPISPPLSKRKNDPLTHALLEPSWGFHDVPKQTAAPAQSTNQRDQSSTVNKDGQETQYMASPVQLTRIRDLAPAKNIDAVSLKDILGDPLIRECWNFNYLFDLHFVMQQFDEDVRDLVKIKIVHGFWKNNKPEKKYLEEMAEPYPGVDLISSYLPDPFGTHHSKMIILFRHDDCAQVIIHTANMISKDWANMTQAVWQSPLLPLCTPTSASPSSSSEKEATRYPIGSGERFKIDLLHYLAKYENRLRALSSQLTNYDFSAVRAAFLGSAPSRQKVSATDPTQHTSLGWLGLQEILSNIPVPKPSALASPHIVLQVSSVATLGPKPTWLSHFQSVLTRCLLPKPTAPTHVSSPKFNIIFPTAQEIRTSLDGYDSGGSIHMRLQSAQQQKQLEYSRTLLCHWDSRSSASPSSPRRQAHRGPAAPHIKTYIRFTDSRDQNIDWALLTSANLSKQAWGELANKDGEVRIQSYETGVVVWPALFADAGTKESASMVPVFGTDMPVSSDVPREAETEVEIDDDETEDEEVNDEDDDETEDEAPSSTRPQSTQPNLSRSGTKASLSNVPTASSIATQQKSNKVVGFRMPYDLPLSPYAPSDEPWCASMSYAVPDWMGVTWGV